MSMAFVTPSSWNLVRPYVSENTRSSSIGTLPAFSRVNSFWSIDRWSFRAGSGFISLRRSVPLSSTHSRWFTPP